MAVDLLLDELTGGSFDEFFEDMGAFDLDDELLDLPEFEEFAERDIALAGADGQRAGELLDASVQAGIETLHALTEQAVRRLLADPDPLDNTMLFTDEELETLSDSIAAAKATADLMGRVRVRRMLDHYEAVPEEPKAETFAEGYTAFRCGCGAVAYNGDPARGTKYIASTYCRACHKRTPQAQLEKFADSFDPAPIPDPPTNTFEPIVAPPPVLRPNHAIDYFRRLFPSLNLRPDRFGPLLDRQAFTMAVATDEVLLGRVKKLILEQIATGSNPDPVGNIRDILDAAGVTSKNPQYAEAVYRTNVQDSYMQGQTAEYSTPEMQAAFPAWEYHAIVDHRARPTHAAKNGLLYPASVTFAEVRGTGPEDVINCRCGASPVYKRELERRLAAGQRIEDSW